MNAEAQDLSISELLTCHREAILSLAQQYGASNVRIFGSTARGEAITNSDVDFLVYFPPNTSIFKVIGLWRELGALLGCKVDLLTDGALDEAMKPRVLRDAVPL